MPQTKKITCTKCFGKGRISAFSHVQGGVCFDCGGKGHRMVAANHKPSILFSIEVTCVRAEGCTLQPGQRGIVFGQKARTAAEALRKAKAKWVPGRSYWFDTESAVALPPT